MASLTRHALNGEVLAIVANAPRDELGRALVIEEAHRLRLVVAMRAGRGVDHPVALFAVPHPPHEKILFFILNNTIVHYFVSDLS